MLYFAKLPCYYCSEKPDYQIHLQEVFADLVDKDREVAINSLADASPFSSSTIFVENHTQYRSSHESYKDHKILCGIYFIIEKMIKSAVITLPTKYAHQWLPESISDSDRELVLIHAGSISIAYAIWAGYKPPLSPLTLLRDIVPLLRITEEMVIDSLSILL